MFLLDPEIVRLARERLQPLVMQHGFKEVSIHNNPGILIAFSSPHLALNMVIDRGPQVWIELAPRDLSPTLSDYYSLEWIARWLGQPDLADQAVTAMPPYIAPLPWAPLEDRITTLCEIALQVIPDFLARLEDDRWPQTKSDLLALRAQKYEDICERLGSPKQVPARRLSGAQAIEWPLLVFILITILSYGAYALFK